MATVDCDRNRYDEYGEQDDSFGDPQEVADVEHSDVARAEEELGGRAAPRREQAVLHRIAEVRRLQGVTLRNVARRLGMSLPVVRRQEQPDCDLRISDLHLWQQVLEVPISELLIEADGQLSGPVLERSRMVKLMKTAAALRERTEGSPAARMVEMLVDQILEIMPELADVTPWPAAGPRRSLDDVGRAARTTVSEDVFRRGAG